MRNAVVSFLVVITLIGAAQALAEGVSLSQAAREVQTAFDESAMWRKTEPDSVGNTKATEAPVNNAYCGSSVFYDGSMVPLLRSLLFGPDSDVWWKAVAGELASPVATRRALACELTQLKKDPGLVPLLAGLIDDKAQAAPVPLWSIGQMAGSNSINWCKNTVGQTATAALLSQTQISFQNKAAFDAWWKVNSNCRDHLWYWGARWANIPWPYVLYESQPGQEHVGPLRPETTTVREPQLPDFKSDLAEIAALPKETALKILLLHDNYYAVEAERKSSFAGAPELAGNPLSSVSHYSPQPSDVAKFIVDNNLKPRLLELLSHKNLWPEVAGSEDAFDSLVGVVSRGIGMSVFTSADEPAIAAAQAKAPAGSSLELVFINLRVQIAPNRARSILTDAMRRKPSGELANLFITRFGTEEPDLLKKCWADRTARYRVSDAIRTAGVGKLPVSKAFIRGLLEPLVYDRRDSCGVLSDLAQAVNAIEGKEVVSKDELHTLFGGKMDSEAQSAFEARAPLAFAAIKKKVLNAL